MKTSEHFKKTITDYLNKRAQSDEQFAKKYAKEGKNIDNCCTYICNWVKKSGCNGFPDEEIFGQAVHYYDEDNIDIGGRTNCAVVVNHTVKLTEEEKAQARKDAIAKVQADAEKALMAKRIAKPKPNIALENPTLF